MALLKQATVLCTLSMKTSVFTAGRASHLLGPSHLPPHTLLLLHIQHHHLQYGACRDF